jgi:Protein of unknown function (DUF3431)
MKIVVARYNEDVEWTKAFPNVLIYNKGSPLQGEYNELSLENVGREGHTYYTYIYDHYDNLENYTAFLQGNPFDHSPNLFNQLNRYIDRCNKKEMTDTFVFLSDIELPLSSYGTRSNERSPYRIIWIL